MSENNVPVFNFLGYRVTNIIYDCAPGFEFPEETMQYSFNFSKALMLLSEHDIQENLCVNIFYSEEGEFDTAQYKLSVELAGRFVCNEPWQKKWEANVLAILFPYLRSIVSTLTSLSGREPIVLPTVNVASLFEE